MFLIYSCLLYTSYKPGEKIKFSITVLKNNVPIPDTEIRYQISEDMMKPHKELSLIHILSNGQKADIILADGTKVYKNRKPQDNKQFYEYSFDGGLVLNVPDVYKRQLLDRLPVSKER